MTFRVVLGFSSLLTSEGKGLGSARGCGEEGK
jgi:hypothetical protein